MNRISITFGVLAAAGVWAPGVSMATINNLELPHAPLTVQSNRVDPNVMLVIDNSGSMQHMVMHSGYNPSGSYENWKSFDYDNHSSRCDRVTARRDGYSGRKTLYLPDPPDRRAWKGKYLDYLFQTFADNQNLCDGSIIPNQTRMETAKSVAIKVLEEVDDVRFGAFKFNNNAGGTLVGECGMGRAELKAKIGNLEARTWTPLAETLYEVTRYFRGESKVFGGSGDYTSPIQYRCQKNFAIVITDGLPTKDGAIPNRSDDPEIDGRSLPNWDGVNNDRPNINTSTEGYNLYLDDIAKFAYDIDMKSGGPDEAGVSWDDPAHPRQYMHTYTIGFTIDNQLLADTADGDHGRGIYMRADDTAQLENALMTALADISEKVLSSSSAASSQGTLTVDTSVISPKYNSLNWSGDLRARTIEFVAGSGYQWVDKWTSAADKLPGWNSRHLIYNKNGTGTRFRWDTFDSTLQTAFFNGEQALLQYIRGNRDNEGTGVGEYRIRASALGDIVYSEPKYMGKPKFRYPDTFESKPYSVFKNTWKNRREMIYVGANDGFLHAFDMETGVEQFAFMPASALPYIKQLASYPYEHRYFVDGSPTVVDAYVNNNWRTVLVGGMNRGGQSVYALDVTNPDGISESNANNLFLWEFTHPELGYSYSQPAIVKLNNGQWAAVFGNGYNSTEQSFDSQFSTSGDAMLFIVDLEDGSLIKTLNTRMGAAEDPTGGSRPNGLATTAPVDIDKDGIIDYVYAGDLFGNMWKFDVSGSNVSQWDVALKHGSTPKPLFKACGGNSCNADNRQPITVRPEVGHHPRGGFLVYFGTGKYIETADKAPESNKLQTFYAIWDKDDGNDVSGRSVLHQQSVLHELTLTPGSETHTVRTTTRSKPDWAVNQGWYMDLPTTRERSVRNPILRNGKIIFNTLIPILQNDPCRVEADSWLMELEATTGSRTKYAHFDLDGNFSFDGGDMVSGGIPPSGLKINGDIPAPTIIADDPEREIKVIQDRLLIENPGVGALGRQSWRQHVNQ